MLSFRNFSPAMLTSFALALTASMAAFGAETPVSQLKAKPAAAKSAPAKPKPVKFSGPLVIAKQDFFFVGGQYTQSKDGQIMVGQMFVQYQIPQARKHKYPIIMIHGGGQTGTNFLGTPDGRPGWAEYFLRQGYAVYVVDQPGRARSGYFTDAYGPTRRPNASAMSERFTVPENSNLYPQAKLHTQWPGKGVAGDPVYDQFFASQVEDMQNLTMLEDLNRNAVSALLDKIRNEKAIGDALAADPDLAGSLEAFEELLARACRHVPLRRIDVVCGVIVFGRRAPPQARARPSRVKWWACSASSLNSSGRSRAYMGLVIRGRRSR